MVHEYVVTHSAAAAALIGTTGRSSLCYKLLEVCMEGVVSSFDDAFLMSIYNLAEALKCSPLDVLDFILRVSAVIFLILGVFLMFFLDHFIRPVTDHVIDRVFDGFAALFRWLCSSRKKNR